jgi:ABC-type lipoprotein release transport system permease subunit
MGMIGVMTMITGMTMVMGMTKSTAIRTNELSAHRE